MPYLYDYQIKGFFKDACRAWRACRTKRGAESLPEVIDGTVFVFPRKIFILSNGDLGDCQRLLRASGPQGERVAWLPETAPAGSKIEFVVELLDDSNGRSLGMARLWQTLRIGQWRNSGKAGSVTKPTPAGVAALAQRCRAKAKLAAPSTAKGKVWHGDAERCKAKASQAAQAQLCKGMAWHSRAGHRKGNR